MDHFLWNALSSPFKPIQALRIARGASDNRERRSRSRADTSEFIFSRASLFLRFRAARVSSFSPMLSRDTKRDRS